MITPPRLPAIETLPTDGPILLFDGECSLCAGVVQFVLPREYAGRVKLASLQSQAGQRLLSHYILPSQYADSLIFIEDGKAFVRSAAAFRLGHYLTWPWQSLSWVLSLLPQRLADWAYNQVARYRYRIFGRRTSCLMMLPGWETRFLVH